MRAALRSSGVRPLEPHCAAIRSAQFAEQTPSSKRAGRISTCPSRQGSSGDWCRRRRAASSVRIQGAEGRSYAKAATTLAKIKFERTLSIASSVEMKTGVYVNNYRAQMTAAGLPQKAGGLAIGFHEFDRLLVEGDEGLCAKPGPFIGDDAVGEIAASFQVGQTGLDRGPIDHDIRGVHQTSDCFH